jgi:hypothetical protein
MGGVSSNSTPTRHSHKEATAEMLSGEVLGYFDLVLLVACGISTGCWIVKCNDLTIETLAISRGYFVNVTSLFPLTVVTIFPLHSIALVDIFRLLFHPHGIILSRSLGVARTSGGNWLHWGGILNKALWTVSIFCIVKKDVFIITQL